MSPTRKELAELFSYTSPRGISQRIQNECCTLKYKMSAVPFCNTEAMGTSPEREWKGHRLSCPPPLHMCVQILAPWN